MNCAEASSTVGLLEGRDRKVASPAFAQYAIGVGDKAADSSTH